MLENEVYKENEFEKKIQSKPNTKPYIYEEHSCRICTKKRNQK